jgi:RNA polymerase sigma factor (sigma-70 family)
MILGKIINCPVTRRPAGPIMSLGSEKIHNVTARRRVFRVNNRPPMEDAELIARCRNGDTGAFEFLVNKYQSSLLSMTWSLLGDKEDARDVSQQAFLAAFSNLDTFDHSRSFKNWLFAIAWKDCLDLKRREKTRRLFLERLKDDPAPAGNPGPAAVPLEESEVFSPFLGKLSLKERLSLTLKMNEGYSAAEIADVLGCAENSARVYAFNAVRKLRKLWNKGKPHV